MPVKLNHYWTIMHDRKKDYEEFIINKFIPKTNKLGLHAVAGWSVLVGGYSEIIFECVCNDLNQLEHALNHPKYKEIKADLFNYVKNYKTKVLVKTGKIDSYSTDIRSETVKYNQMWNLISEKKKEYGQYTIKEFYPMLESLGISVASEWEVLIGDGPSIICEGRVKDVSNLISNLQSKNFRHAKNLLKGFVENYESRILTFHIHKQKGYKSESYDIISD
jgi:hypothetical protein